MKWKVWMAAAVLVFGMAGTCLADEEEREDWVSPEVANYTLRKNPYYENTLYDISCMFSNVSDTGIMEIQYTITFTDDDGEVLSEISRVYNGEDTPLAPGGEVTVETSGRFETVVTEKDIAGVTITVSGIYSEEEKPPVHLPQKGEYLYQALGNAYLENILEVPPVRIETWIDHMGARETAIVTDPDTIQEMVQAFVKISIQDETDEWVTDNYNGILMTFENEETGEEERIFISLNLTNLEFQVYGNDHMYELGDLGEFWGMMQMYAVYEEGEPHDDA